MMLRCLLAGAGLAALAASSAAAADMPPLYADFQTFCVATGAKPDAIKAALAAADVKPHRAKPGEDAAPPSWDHTVGGFVLTISYGTSRTGSPDGRKDLAQEHCVIASNPVDPEGITAILNWVQLKPNVSHKGPTTTFFYQYEEKDGVRRDLMADDIAFGHAIDDGTAWNLLLDWAPGGSLVFIDHYPAARAP